LTEIMLMISVINGTTTKDSARSSKITCVPLRLFKLLFFRALFFAMRFHPAINIWYNVKYTTTGVQREGFLRMEPQYRIIFHIDLNAFFASCEITRRPELAHRPVAVGGRKGSARGVVTTANYVARKFGIHSAMPMATAKRKCRQLVVLPADFELYKKVSRQFFEMLGEYSPLVEKASIDEAYMDMSHHFPKNHPQALAHQIQKRVNEELGIGCSIGIAPNKFLAKMASDMKKPNGLTILRKRDLPSILWPLPIEAMHGIGKSSAPKLKLMGIETIGDLANLKDTAKMEQLLGPHSLKWVDRAKGKDRRPVDVERYDTLASIGHSTTFPKDYVFEEQIKGKLLLMCQKTARRLMVGKKYGKTISVQMKGADFKNASKSKTLAVPIQRAEEIYQIAEELFDGHWEGEPLRLIGVTAANLTSSKKVTTQLDLFNYQSFATEEKINKTVREITKKHGSVLSKGIAKHEPKI